MPHRYPAADLRARRSGLGGAGRGAAHSRRTRLVFVTSLVTFGVASIYTCIALLARVTPALFPGTNLLNLAPFTPLESLGVSAPTAASIFNQRINVLVFGVDIRPGDPYSNAANTDTIMVASIDPMSKRMSLLSIPRDSWVDIHPPGSAPYQQRINTSWAIGYLDTHTLDGAAAQLETDLKDDFGININYWVMLNFRGTEQLIDDIGGVDVTIPAELAVPRSLYSDDDVHAQVIDFPAGPMHLNGYNAVAFGRYRDTDNDLVRIQRQHLVLSAALQKVASLGLLSNPIQLWNDYHALVQTDIPEARLPGYALLVKDANPKLQMYSLGNAVNGVETVTPWTTPAGADVLLLNMTNVQYWINQAFPNPAYVDSSIEIRDARGGSPGGQEQALGDYLKARGLDNVDLGPNDPPQAGTEIDVNGSSWRDLGMQLAQWLKLPDSAVNVQGPVGDGPDVVVKVGSGFTIPPGP